MTLSNATLARAVLAVIRATKDTPALPMLLRSKDFSLLAASIAALPEINDVDQLRDLKAQVQQDFAQADTSYKAELLALRDQIDTLLGH